MGMGAMPTFLDGSLPCVSSGIVFVAGSRDAGVDGLFSSVKFSSSARQIMGGMDSHIRQIAKQLSFLSIIRRMWYQT
jgi:hypothetical protein